jgi:hypothetical protein
MGQSHRPGDDGLQTSEHGEKKSSDIHTGDPPRMVLSMLHPCSQARTGLALLVTNDGGFRCAKTTSQNRRPVS